MIHKRAYFRGLLKVAAVQPAPMPSYVQVGRGTRRPTPHQEYKIDNKTLTYGDLGFTDQGIYDRDDTRYDPSKVNNTNNKPSFIEFLSDENLAGDHYIPAKSMRATSHAMARIRGGTVPLSQQSVSQSDVNSYLEAAYKHARDGRVYSNPNNDSSILHNARKAYQDYLRTGKGNQYQQLQKYNQDPAGTSNMPAPVAPLPTSIITDGDAGNGGDAVKDKADVQPTAYTPKDIQLTDDDRTVVTAYYRLTLPYYSDQADAYKKGEYYVSKKSPGDKSRIPFVGDLFKGAGIDVAGGWFDSYEKQRQYQRRYRNLAIHSGFMNTDGTWIEGRGGQAAYQKWLVSLYKQGQRYE